MTNNDTGIRILETITKRSDNNEWYKTIIYSRLNNVSDLKEQRARYHDRCMMRFYNY